MAIDVTIDNTSEAAAANELRRDRVSELRRRSTQLPLQVDAALTEASKIANASYERAWDMLQGLLEKNAIGWPIFGMIIFAPIVTALYLTRLMVGNLMHGGFTVGWRSFQVQAIPGLKIYAIERHVMALILGIITIFEIITIAILVSVVSDPGFAAQFGLCTLFHATCT